MPKHRLKKPLLLENGGELINAEINYTIEGEPKNEGENVVVVCHTLTGGTKIVGSKQWSFIDPGETIDTQKHCIIALGTLGSFNTSTGPKSLNPEGIKYGPNFPTVTIKDSVTAHSQVLDLLGIKKAKAVIGGCYGGFTAYTWLAMKPNFFETALIFQSSLCCSAHTIAMFSVFREMITSSPRWKNGYYRQEEIKNFHEYIQMFAVTRLIQMGHAKFEEIFPIEERRQQRDTSAPYWSKHSSIDEYAIKTPNYVEQLDPNTLLSVLRSEALFDLEASFPDLWDRWSKLKTRVLHLPCIEDWRYPISTMQAIHHKMRRHGIKSHFRPTSSRYGHGSFLFDPPSLKKVLPMIKKIMDESE